MAIVGPSDYKKPHNSQSPSNHRLDARLIKAKVGRETFIFLQLKLEMHQIEC